VYAMPSLGVQELCGDLVEHSEVGGDRRGVSPENFSVGEIRPLAEGTFACLHSRDDPIPPTLTSAESCSYFFFSSDPLAHTHSKG